MTASDSASINTDRQNRFRRQSDMFLLSIGLVLSIAGLIGLIADSHRHFLLVLPIIGLQLLLILMSLFAFKHRQHRLYFDLSLLGNTLITLAMFVLIHTTLRHTIPQWSVFVLWAIAITPWACSAYTGLIWLVWVLALNSSVYVAYTHLRASHPLELWAVLCSTNVALLMLWEYLSTKTKVFNTRAGPRLLAFLSLLSSSVLAYLSLGDTLLPMAQQILSTVPMAMISLVFMIRWGLNGNDLFISCLTAFGIGIATPLFLGHALFSHPDIPSTFAFYSVLFTAIVLWMILGFWLRRCFVNKKRINQTNVT